MSLNTKYQDRVGIPEKLGRSAESAERKEEVKTVEKPGYVPYKTSAHPVVFCRLRVFSSPDFPPTWIRYSRISHMHDDDGESIKYISLLLDDDINSVVIQGDDLGELLDQLSECSVKQIWEFNEKKWPESKPEPGKPIVTKIELTRRKMRNDLQLKKAAGESEASPATKH